MRMPRTLQELLAEAGEGSLIHTAHMNVFKSGDGYALRFGITGVERRHAFSAHHNNLSVNAPDPEELLVESDKR
jgi:hypothetical protein